MFHSMTHFVDHGNEFSDAPQILSAGLAILAE